MRVQITDFDVPSKVSEIQPGDWLYDGLVTGKVIKRGKIGGYDGFLVETWFGKTFFPAHVVSNAGVEFVPIEED